jgi:hypothetical protein
LLYPGYRSDQEILLPCSPTYFESPASELAGNHVATIDASRERLREIEPGMREIVGRDPPNQPFWRRFRCDFSSAIPRNTTTPSPAVTRRLRGLPG